jgi:glutamyl/glutaminyl-tRNA synthetase
VQKSRPNMPTIKTLDPKVWGSGESPTYIGRLAPSPTGLLHLGHARTFLIAHDRAREANGKLWLRNEDLDAQRSRPEFATAMREDLAWLGITWDSEARQSDRLPLYREAMQRLVASGYAYPCNCSRKDLQQATQAPHEDSDDEPVYSGRCRPLQSATALSGETWDTNQNYRFRVPDNESIAFLDGHFGQQSFISGCAASADFGDFLVWRKDGFPSYQLACVVDDAAMGITEVVRGADLLKSTARQILLQRTLGFATPTYFHCDLMRDDNGIRLAKRHDALSLRKLREEGISPQDLRARMMAK